MGSPQSKTTVERGKQDIDVEKFLALQESIDRFTGDALIEEIKRNIRRFGPEPPTEEALKAYYLGYKPIMDKKRVQLPKLYEAAKAAKFDCAKYHKEFEAEKAAIKAKEEKKAAEKKEKKEGIQKKHQKEFLERFNAFEQEHWKRPGCLKTLRSPCCGLASCIACPTMACLIPWFCAGRPSIPGCKCIEESMAADEIKKYGEEGPMKVIRCQECFVPCCLTVGFTTLYYKIMAQMKDKVDKIIRGGNNVNQEMMDKMEVEKEYAIFAIDNFRNAKGSLWRDFVEYAKKEKLDFNFANEKAKAIGDHPVTKLTEFNLFDAKHIPSLFDCPKVPDEFKAVVGTHHLLRNMMQELAAEVKVRFDKVLEELFPGKMKFASLKAERRMIEKLPDYGFPLEGENKGQYGSRYDRVVDIVRCSYICTTLDEVLEAGKKFMDIEKLSNGQLKLTRLKNGFASPGKEYPKLGISLMAFDLMICEVQITTEDIKQTGAIDHFYYEIIRSPSSKSFFETHYKAKVEIAEGAELYPIPWDKEMLKDTMCGGICPCYYESRHNSNEKEKAEKMNKNLTFESALPF